jgi:hypothetical protein
MVMSTIKCQVCVPVYQPMVRPCRHCRTIQRERERETERERELDCPIPSSLASLFLSTSDKKSIGKAEEGYRAGTVFCHKAAGNALPDRHRCACFFAVAIVLSSPTAGRPQVGGMRPEMGSSCRCPTSGRTNERCARMERPGQGGAPARQRHQFLRRRRRYGSPVPKNVQPQELALPKLKTRRDVTLIKQLGTAKSKHWRRSRVAGAGATAGIESHCPLREHDPVAWHLGLVRVRNDTQRASRKHGGRGREGPSPHRLHSPGTRPGIHYAGSEASARGTAVTRRSSSETTSPGVAGK